VIDLPAPEASVVVRVKDDLLHRRPRPQSELVEQLDAKTKRNVDDDVLPSTCWLMPRERMSPLDVCTTTRCA
jgi:hypothetical protein